MGSDKTIRPVLLATALEEKSAKNLMNALQEEYPALEFSRILSVPSQTWKVHVSSKPGIVLDEFKIKCFCLKLISQKCQ